MSEPQKTQKGSWEKIPARLGHWDHGSGYWRLGLRDEVPCSAESRHEEVP